MKKMLNSSSISLNVKLGRRIIRRGMARFEHGSLSGSPIFFANSFPKSGTHLLTQVLKGFAQLGPAVDSGLPAIVTFDGPSGRQRPIEIILRELERLRAGDIAYGHLHALPEIANFFSSNSFVTYFIFRDPRDVVVSHVHYVTEIEPNHVHHWYYSTDLKDFDERLMASILGRPDLQVPFPNIAARFEPYLSWLDCAKVLSLRYEDFIMNRDDTLLKIIDHAVSMGFRLEVPTDEALELLIDAINPTKSPTFRRGKVGGWKEYFTEEHVKIFKKVCGDLLIRLGYEENNNW